MNTGEKWYTGLSCIAALGGALLWFQDIEQAMLFYVLAIWLTLCAIYERLPPRL